MGRKSEHQKLPLLINEIIENNPQNVDLTSELHLQALLESVDRILDDDLQIEDIESWEKDLLETDRENYLFTLLCLKLAKSKLLVNNIAVPLRISVVFAVYKEHHRIMKSSEHPHGEDFLIKKVEQLEWLFKASKGISWEIIIVDDGCPEYSGQFAQDIINENQLGDKVKVLYLKDAIAQNLPPAMNLTSTADSQKGGSIIYGMWDAIQKNKSTNHIVVYTDADLSTHLGQLGLLINPILNKDKLVGIGSRREPDSVVIKKGGRNTRGKLFIYLWKRLIPNLDYIVDTQCGFKAFSASILPAIMDQLIEKKFAFDIELLLRAEQQKDKSISKVPIAWIDSEEASTTTDLQPYLTMLKAIAKMYQKYFEQSASADEFAKFIESLDETKFEELLDNIPEEIINREPDEFAEFDEVKPDYLVRAINE